jgi:hypothetical protein
LKELLRGKVPEYPQPESLGKLELSIPDSGTFYDFYFQVIKKNNFRLFEFKNNYIFQFSLKTKENGDHLMTF